MITGKEPNMTDKEKLMAGYRMWSWLSENSDKVKSDWPEWDINGGEIDTIPTHCFACDVAGNTHGSSDACDKCPIEWPGGRCYNQNSLFTAWEFFSEGKIREHYASIIAELHLQAAKKIKEVGLPKQLAYGQRLTRIESYRFIYGVGASNVGRFIEEAASPGLIEEIIHRYNNYEEMLKYIKAKGECEGLTCDGCYVNKYRVSAVGQGDCIKTYKALYEKLTKK